MQDKQRVKKFTNFQQLLQVLVAFPQFLLFALRSTFSCKRPWLETISCACGIPSRSWVCAVSVRLSFKRCPTFAQELRLSCLNAARQAECFPKGENKSAF